MSPSASWFLIQACMCASLQEECTHNARDNNTHCAPLPKCAIMLAACFGSLAAISSTVLAASCCRMPLLPMPSQAGIPSSLSCLGLLIAPTVPDIRTTLLSLPTSTRLLCWRLPTGAASPAGHTLNHASLPTPCTQCPQTPTALATAHMRAGPFWLAACALSRAL